MKRPFTFLATLLLTILTIFVLASPARSGSGDVIYLPFLIQPGAADDGDDGDDGEGPETRQSSQRFFEEVYLAAEGAEPGWTGQHDTCDAGSTSQAFRDTILLRINYFRAMAGVPELEGLSDVYNAKAQQAALMMSVNDALSHSPPADWTCYTDEGAEAAGSSNLYLVNYGLSAIDGYIRDPGDNNYRVGHRRWLLYPQTRTMGTGDVPPANGYSGANALWVFDEHIWDDRPATREPYVAWPPPGYVPWQVVYPRWSLSYDDADFSAAEVSMTRNGVPLALDVMPVEDGPGENTLVWEPNAQFGVMTPEDVTYTVEVQNVLIDGEVHSFPYSVVVFDPGTDVEVVGEQGVLGEEPRVETKLGE